MSDQPSEESSSNDQPSQDPTSESSQDQSSVPCPEDKRQAIIKFLEHEEGFRSTWYKVNLMLAHTLYFGVVFFGFAATILTLASSSRVAAAIAAAMSPLAASLERSFRFRKRTAYQRIKLRRAERALIQIKLCGADALKVLDEWLSADRRTDKDWPDFPPIGGAKSALGISELAADATFSASQRRAGGAAEAEHALPHPE